MRCWRHWIDLALMTAATIRNLTLAIPLVGLIALLLGRRPSPRTSAAAFLAGMWVAVAIAIIHASVPDRWWTYAASPTAILGLPLEALLGWAIIWGAVPALAGGPWWAWLLGLGWLDAVAMPAMSPMVLLGPTWWRGELLVLAVGLLPALVLGHCTRTRRWLALRVGMQVALFGSVVLVGLPNLVLSQTGGSWAALGQQPLAIRAVLFVVAALAAVLALSAVAELARVGRGTPFPWDPPEQLVISGPYAYLANPMQAGGVALLAVLGVGVGSWMLVAAAGSAGLLSFAVFDWHERETLARRWADYRAWRSSVRPWVPSWRPHGLPGSELDVDAECAICRATGRLLTAPGLAVSAIPAAENGLRRLRYRNEHVGAEGIAAVGRALEHRNLALAVLGWGIRLPGVDLALQSLADATGLGPVGMRCSDPASPRVHQGGLPHRRRADHS